MTQSDLSVADDPVNLKITAAGPLVTVQDLGRFGSQRYGVPVSGAMDGLAVRTANELVRNPWSCACLEMGPGDLSVAADEPCVVALTGRGVSLSVNDCPLPLWSAIFVRTGWRIDIRRLDWGWAYLAIAGGVDVPLRLGSRSTYIRGGLGGFSGRPLRSGDIIPIGQSRLRPEIAGREMAPPDYAEELVAEVVLGPQLDRFTSGAVAQFLTSEYTITLQSDRMGYRLQGEALAHRQGADLVSDGIALGTLQVPANGQPILMMSDHATTGGYTKIATMATLDVWRVAQCSPGRGKIRFKAVSVEAAQLKYRQTLGALASRVTDWQDEASYSW